MKRLMQILPLLVFFASIAHGEEVHVLARLETALVPGQFPAGGSALFSNDNCADTSSGANFGLNCLELKDEDLGQIKGRALDSAASDINTPQVSGIILWDEVEENYGVTANLGGGQSITIISGMGR